MQKEYLIILSSIVAASLWADAKTYELTAPSAWEPIRSDHLRMGGSNPDGGTIEVNNFYMIRDGKPAVPVCGEFHYSRYPAEQWEQEIIKMRAGGINVLPTYVFWSLHEPDEGKWVWSGNRDLRRFFELCKKHGMDVIVRIGPFGHGEIRNGAIPDWIFAKNMDIRSDDPRYLAYVEKLYKQIASQIDGLYYKDGGPIIGCQIENEHQHSAAPWAIEYFGEPVHDFTAASYDKGITKLGVSAQENRISRAEMGNRHMRKLLEMAKDAGIVTPFYTATGWGNAAVIDGDAIPVTSAYTYATWLPDQRKSEFCMFKDIWREPDYSPVRYAPTDYPSAAAEMGVGIQMVYSKRPVCTGEVAEALMTRVLGSGSNIIGYYMYHGGSTPLMEGNKQFFSDQPMGLPKVSYDFQAPLGEFGLEAPSYRPLRVIHNFLNDFADRLAPMQSVFPENIKTMTPDNKDDLRYAARMTPDGEGFLFLINTQDHDDGRRDQTDLQVVLNLPGERLSVPETGGFTLPKNTSAILPFNFDMDGVRLKYALAQPLMRIDDNGTPHYFFTVRDGMKPEYVFDRATVSGRDKFKNVVAGYKSTFTVKGKNGKKVKVTTLPFGDAKNAVKAGGKILVTEASVLPESEYMRLLSLGNPDFEYVLYPSAKGFATQKVSVDSVQAALAIDKSVPWRMEVTFTDDASKHSQVNEFFLSVPYTGDVAMAFLDNAMILDHFWQGEPWNIGLNRFAVKMGKGKPMGFYFRSLRKNAPFLQDLPAERLPDFSNGPVLDIPDPVILPEYTVTVPL